jgi:hypothetical protein
MCNRSVRAVFSMLPALLLAACGDAEDRPLGNLGLTMGATPHSEVVEFRIRVTDLLTDTVVADRVLPVDSGGGSGRATAYYLLTLAARPHLVSGEARDSEGSTLAYREAWVAIARAQTSFVSLVFDIASVPLEGDLVAELVTNNGADLTRTSLTERHPGPSSWQSIGIHGTTDYENGWTYTGFVATGSALIFTSGPVFFGGFSTSLGFHFPEAPGVFVVIAAAIDDYQMGTAHLFTFDTNAQTSSMEVYRVHDIYDLNQDTKQDILVLSRAASSLNPTSEVRMFVDTDGDGRADWEASYDDHTILSWERRPTNPVSYQVRVRDNVSPFRVSRSAIYAGSPNYFVYEYIE